VSSTGSIPRAARIAFLVVAAWLVVYELRATVGLDALPGALFGAAAQITVAVTPGLLCLWRALSRRDERRAWLLVGIGVLSWGLGDAYFNVAALRGDVPVPSPADLGYLCFIPLAFVGFALLIRSRLPHAARTLWIDGVTAALAAAAASAAIVFQAVSDTVGGGSLANATNLAYPLGDLVLLGMVVAVAALNGWRPDRAWLALGGGIVIFLASDSLYLVQTAQGTYADGSFYDAGWWAGLLVIARASWIPARPLVKRSRREGTVTILLPLLFALFGLGLLVVASFHHVNALAVGLAGASLLAVMARLVVSFQNNVELLSGSRREAVTDPLTKLGNRRKLVADLDAAFAQAQESPSMLVLFDLDGFKRYNDTFGHMAGDSLLARLGGALAAALGPHGTAYRMGGDEFCALTRMDGPPTDAVLAAAVAALSDKGDLFEISTSYGTVFIPYEAETPELALRVADERLYGQKNARSGSARQQTRDVLLGLLREREPSLLEHLHDVGALARAVGMRLSLAGEDLDELTRAAELHDIGKAAIPDAILSKPGPLTDSEWAFMRRHTIIGERILSAAPALVPVARIVRSSHERWDGTGYPDALAGEDIPLGARIVAVCDAFHAMTTDRPYKRACAVREALAELRRCAGTQFDPAVLEAFADTLQREASVHPGGATTSEARGAPKGAAPVLAMWKTTDSG
jgi:two-component system cell cycle response regulator